MTDTISPWQPERDRLRLAVLGKLIEEANEMGARAARCIIHGLDERDPKSGLSNRDELAREISDVSACIRTLEKLGIRVDQNRTLGKVDGFRRWHAMLDEPEADHG